MKNIDRTSDLFTIAIAAENAAMHFYRGLSRLFSHVPEVSLFWQGMMNDEALHAQALKDIRNRMTAEQLNLPADRSLISKARRELQEFAGKCDLAAVGTLDDAYEIAYDLEYSEVNAVFQAIIGESVPSDVRLKFVTQIREHVSKLEDFSKTIVNAERMKTITAGHRRHG
jgi:rubrerythrin